MQPLPCPVSHPTRNKPNLTAVAADRCYHGSLSSSDFIHLSSGSSGKPTYWARSAEDECDVAVRFEQIFRDAFKAQDRSTLAVICFPLGGWVGGIFTTFIMRYLSQKGYPLTVVTPSNKVPDILQFINDLGAAFDQVVLLGYPPFIKGVIDAGEYPACALLTAFEPWVSSYSFTEARLYCPPGLAAKLDWSSFAVKMVLAGEVFSEEWRALMAERAGIDMPLRDIVSIYGTADAGVIAVDTPLTATIRHWLSQHPAVAAELFGKERLPTLAQYEPTFRLLEINPHDGTLVVTAISSQLLTNDNEDQAFTAQDEHIKGMLPPQQQQMPIQHHEGTCQQRLRGAPLLRYCIGDEGGIISFDDLMASLAAHGCNPLDSCKDAVVRQQPFVWVFGRSFWAVSLYGANVYVENAMTGLEQNHLSAHVTGKFVLFVHQDADLNDRLAIRVELAQGQTASQELEALVADSIQQQMLRLNSEFANYVPAERQLPLVLLYEFGNPEFFPVGVKHRYIL
eukprot:jgi/Chrzof1/12277/Cz06g28120.t1